MVAHDGLVQQQSCPVPLLFQADNVYLFTDWPAPDEDCVSIVKFHIKYDDKCLIGKYYFPSTLDLYHSIG